MAAKFIVLAALVALARATVVTHPVVYTHQPVVKTVVDSEFDPNPQYTFAYDVQDPFTGDSKNQIESRSGDVVHGSYSLNDPDGTRRTVDYTADPVNGFNAVVKKSPLLQTVVKSVPVVHEKVVTPVVATKAAVAPVAYTPVVQKVVDSPLVYSNAYGYPYGYPYGYHAVGVPYVKAHYY